MMIRCEHLQDEGTAEEDIRKARAIQGDFSAGNISTYCRVCGQDENPYVNLATGVVYCMEHVAELPGNVSTSPRFLCLQSGEIYCALCNYSLPIEDSGIMSARYPASGCRILKKIGDLGGTTALGALVQIILNVPGMQQYFFSFHHGIRSCERDPCPDCFFKKLISQVYSPGPVDISETVYYLMKRTEDSRESILENLNDTFTFLTNIYHAHQEGSEDCQCIMHRIFFGSLQRTKRCAVCKTEMVSIEEVSTITVPLYRELIAAIDEVFTMRITSAYFYCRHCRCPVPSYSQKRLVRLPKVLCIHVARVVFTGSGGHNMTKIKVPCQLTLEDIEYNLYAFIVQKKNVSAACIAYIRLNGIWYEFQSDRVSEGVEIAKSVSSATLFFFTRKGAGESE